jgi:Holliday junction DNA helicase RuvA
MIATIEGKVGEKLGGLVIVQTGGIGYGLYVTPEDHGHLKIGELAKLYIHEHIRENAYDLYGFSDVGTKVLFEQLLDVSGVGPKMALAILSVGSAQEVRSSIASGETKFLQGAPGVGKRVAERVVVELKDKVGVAATDNIDSILKSTNAQADEAAQALIALGYTASDALEALNGIDSKLPTEERVKQALKG